MCAQQLYNPVSLLLVYIIMLCTVHDPYKPCSYVYNTHVCATYVIIYVYECMCY